MPVYTKGDFHGGFVVMNVSAVDIASLAAGAMANVDIDVEALDGVDQAPLQTTDFVVGPVAGFDAMTTPITFIQAIVLDTNTVRLRIGNASAGALDPASIAANNIKFLVFRR